MKLKRLFLILTAVFSTKFVHATYADQDKYTHLLENLRQSTHPWALKFVQTMDQINQRQEADLDWLSTEINQSNDGKDENAYAFEIKEILNQESVFSESLLNTMRLDGKKASDHWTLFTGLNKMAGEDGIYQIGAKYLGQNPALVFDITRKKPYFNSDLSVIKTIGLETLISLRNIEPGSVEDWNEIVPHLGIYCPNRFEDDFEKYAEAASALNFTSTGEDDIATYWRPSASYEFGGNNPDHHIWDCSSFVAYVTDCPWRFSTAHQAIGWGRQIHSSLEPTGISEQAWKQFDDLYEAISDVAERQPMDILVYRGKQSGGHTGFYLGEDPEKEGNILLAEMNRFDDKSFDGIGIRSASLVEYERRGSVYFFRKRDSRM